MQRSGAADDIVLRGARVSLRRWRESDLGSFAAMNADAEVMRHFLAPLAREQSDAAAARIAAHHERRGYGWWVLQVPGLDFAGCVGLVDVGFELPCLQAPQVEVGWRLPTAAWGQGYATEAAARVLVHARDALALQRVVSFTALTNRRSMALMQRLGMVELAHFEHPRIAPGHALRPHVLYTTAWH